MLRGITVRRLLSLLACLMLVVTLWGGAVQAAALDCNETMGQMAVHIAGDCDEVPADAHKNYPHCHTGCHGQHVDAPMPFRVVIRVSDLSRDYIPAAEGTLAAHQFGPTLRPPQA